MTIRTLPYLLKLFIIGIGITSIYLIASQIIDGRRDWSIIVSAILVSVNGILCLGIAVFAAIDTARGLKRLYVECQWWAKALRMLYRARKSFGSHIIS